MDPLPVFLEDNHAGTLEFLAGHLDYSREHVLVLVDAHADDSAPPGLDSLRRTLTRSSPQERREAVRRWRHQGTLQSFNWILPLLPTPIRQVLWVRRGAEPRSAQLPPGMKTVELGALAAALRPDMRVVASIDLDTFAGLPPELASARFEEVWKTVVGLPRIAAVTFAISRPWLADDSEASTLVRRALDASFALAHARVRFEPWGVDGPDRSERAKELYRTGHEPPRFDPELAGPGLRALLVGHADRISVEYEPQRWHELLSRWKAEGQEWQLTVEGVQASADGIFRVSGDTLPRLRLAGEAPGRVRSVKWLSWSPRAWAYTVLPDLPAGKVFVSSAPPLVEYEATTLARTTDLTLEASQFEAALPGPDHTGVVRLSAELDLDDGKVQTARIELRRAKGSGFRAGLYEQFGLPYVFGAGFLRRGELRGPDTGVGNDCANFLVAAWRRSGLRMPWSNPAQLRRHLTLVARDLTPAARPSIPADSETRGLVVHLGTHVAALWEDRPPLGSLGDEDLVVHHLGRAPEVLPLAALLAGRPRGNFDLYLGPSRRAVSWVAVGGDLMPGSQGDPPADLREALASADLAVANLETVVAAHGQPEARRYTFRIDPSRLAVLGELGVDALSLANNHSGDLGAPGLSSTMRAFDDIGLGRFGASDDLQTAVRSWFGVAGGTTVALLGVNLTDTATFPAGPARPGVATLPDHAVQIAEAISDARQRAKVVIVMPHWGTEGTEVVSDDQRRWARWLVNQGADAVVGSGPHLVQASDSIDGVPVFYSVGNLWFPGFWPRGVHPGALAMIGLSEHGRIVEARLETPGPLPARAGDRKAP